MTIKVINTGFGRTGTNSIKEALEILGFPCFHMLEILKTNRSSLFWLDALDGKDVDYEAYFGDFEATVDWPSLTLYKELITRYPEAKVIHSVRDGEKWYESARNTIYAASKLTPWPPMSFFIPERVRNHRKMVDRLIWEHDFDGRFEDKDYAISKMHEHLQNVLDFKGKENVLIYRV